MRISGTKNAIGFTMAIAVVGGSRERVNHTDESRHLHW